MKSHKVILIMIFGLKGGSHTAVVSQWQLPYNWRNKNVKEKVTNRSSVDSMNVGWAEILTNRKRGFGIILTHLGKGESNHNNLR